jgi:Amidohydrolase
MHPIMQQAKMHASTGAPMFANLRPIAALSWLLLTALPSQAAEPLPLFDAHLHYSHDAWERLPPKDAIALLRKAGLKRAMVSSSSDEGTQMLYAEAPDLVLPVLRPYRTRSEISTWLNDSTVIAHLQKRLATFRYVAIGEYHVYGADADLPVMRRVVQLAREYKLFLHSHSDADAIERQFKQDPNARILWAHSGFDTPERVAAMLRRHPNLWCDLAFRSDHASGASVDPAWRAVFLEFPTRFMLGTDTFTPERWYYVGEHANWSRQWLASLPRDVAERMAYKNGEAVFAEMWAKTTAK